MAYDTSERSIQDGAPREVYRFTGTYNTYRMTSYYQQLVVNGETYAPFTIQRGAFKVGTQEESQLALEISIPFNHPMVREYAYDQAPPTLLCEIIRVHETDLNDSILLWSGIVSSFTVEGLVCKIRVPSRFSQILQGSAPMPRYQAPCNHILYDSRCQVSEGGFSHATTAVQQVGNQVEVASNPFSSNQLRAGMVRLQSSNESRMIQSAVGTDIRVSYPFSTIQPGDAITLLQGCDHALNGDCLNKFNNTINFGGFPLVPRRNPFTGKI